MSYGPIGKSVDRVACLKAALTREPGLSCGVLAERLGLTKNQVVSLRRRHIAGKDGFPAQPQIRPFTDEERASCIQVFAAHGDREAAAAKLGLTMLMFGQRAAISEAICGMPVSRHGRASRARSQRPKAERLRRTAPAILPQPESAPPAAPAPRQALPAQRPPERRSIMLERGSSVSLGKEIGCQWPAKGDTPLDSRRTVEWCGEKREGSGPYCASHHDRAYVRVRAGSWLDVS